MNNQQARQLHTNQHSRLAHAVHERQREPPRFETSLIDLCRSVIVAHLERYPAAVFGICDPEEWESIIRLRHKKTQPKSGSGGLDGSGRQAPALSEKVLREIEAQNLHLAESKVVDDLVWKDCVEFRFRRDGMSRPKGLRLPWPELLQTVKNSVESLEANDGDTDRRIEAIDILEETPMNISLLQATGVGKTLRKMVKRCKEDSTFPTDQLKRLEDILQSWKSLASDASNAQMSCDETLLHDMELAEKCWTWRQLFAVLKERQDNLRTSQGRKMREAREKLASDRPKVVKVRPATAKQNRILERPSSTTQISTSLPASKLSKLRQETVQSNQRLTASPAKRTGPSFGDAVAFASTKKRKTETRTQVTLAGGKVMHVPSMTPRQVPSNKATQKLKALLKKR